MAGWRPVELGGGAVRLWSRDYRGVRWIQKGRDQQPSARTLGRSQSHDYRVCTVHRGLMTGIHWQESACACACTLCVCGYITQTVECVCVWVCAYLAMKIAGTAGLKKQPQHVGRCSTKTETHRARVAAETGSDGDSRWQNRKRDLRKGGRHNDSDGEAHIQKKTEAAGSAFQSCSNWRLIWILATQHHVSDMMWNLSNFGGQVTGFVSHPTNQQNFCFAA